VCVHLQPGNARNSFAPDGHEPGATRTFGETIHELNEKEHRDQS
jgi:hypothetical protein